MDSYEIRWKGSAERDLRNIDRQQISRIIDAVESLADNPFPPQYRKLRGSEVDYRIRVGDYRVIYQVDTKTNIVTEQFGNSKKFLNVGGCLKGVGPLQG